MEGGCDLFLEVMNGIFELDQNSRDVSNIDIFGTHTLLQQNALSHISIVRDGEYQRG